jgi:hypothetical protein
MAQFPQIIPFNQAAQFFMGRGGTPNPTPTPGLGEIIPFEKAQQFFLGSPSPRPSRMLPQVGAAPASASIPTDKRALADMIAQAGAHVFGPDEVPALLQIVQKESGFNPKAQNKRSTAHGLFQFLDSTWKGTGIEKTDDPTQQVIAGLKYIENRYKKPSKALEHHIKNNWY